MQLFDSIVGTTFRWLDVTPTSRIIARFTADIDAVDDSLSEVFLDLMCESYLLKHSNSETGRIAASTISLLIRFLAILIFTPLFFIPGVLVGIIGVWFQRIYMVSQLSVKREMSNASAPVLGQ
jgi:ABC-type multidrug transport system fused ATPase/permease subunit